MSTGDSVGLLAGQHAETFFEGVGSEVLLCVVNFSISEMEKISLKDGIQNVRSWKIASSCEGSWQLRNEKTF